MADSAPRLINQYDTGGQWYRANFHCHAERDHGEEYASAEELVAAYRELDYNVLGISQHYKFEDFSRFDDPAGDSGAPFIMIPCEEAGDPHVVAIGIDSEVPRVEGGRGTIARLAEMVRDRGGLAVVAHPSWTGLSEFDLLEGGDYFGLEVYNELCQYANGKGRSVEVWDRLLCAGRRVWGLAGDDAHRITLHDGWSEIGRGWVDILAGELTREAIMDSLRAGSFVASQGPRVRRVAVEGDVLVIECTPCREAHFASRSFGAWSDYAPPGETKERFELDLVKHRGRFSTYIRCEVIDERGMVAWTNPLFVKE